MNEGFCSVIVFGPGAPRTLKLHLSRRAIGILVFAFLLSFFAVVLMGYTFPPTVSDIHRSKLEAENHALKVETSYADIGIRKLHPKVSELEAQTKRINELVEP